MLSQLAAIVWWCASATTRSCTGTRASSTRPEISQPSWPSAPSSTIRCANSRCGGAIAFSFIASNVASITAVSRCDRLRLATIVTTVFAAPVGALLTRRCPPSHHLLVLAVRLVERVERERTASSRRSQR